MKIIIRGDELIATEALGASTLLNLVPLAHRRPLFVNGVELQAQDLIKLAEQARQTGEAIRLGNIERIESGIRPSRKQFSSKSSRIKESKRPQPLRASR